MRSALLMVDMQCDFLDRAGLYPPSSELVTRCAALLSACRGLGVPILHAYTLIRPDGTDRMPHWKKSDYRACVAGTPGAQPPPSLAPLPNETVFNKRFFSAFGNPQLEQALKALEIDTLILAGVYTHSCIRATALDAYERSYEVMVAQDAVGSTEPAHAEISRDYLERRAATFLRSEEILARCTGRLPVPPPSPVRLPVACINHQWRDSETAWRRGHRNPADLDEMISIVPMAGATEVSLAARAAHDAWGEWRHVGPAVRNALLLKWENVLKEKSTAFADLMAREIGKPIIDGREELGRALGHVASAARLAAAEMVVEKNVTVCYRPVGCIGLITPWNNPVAIPVSKIAAALAFGNTLVWKPAPQSSRISMLLMGSLIEAGAPAGVINVVFGDADTARSLIGDPGITAISLTGSIATGRHAAALCGLHNKPLQAELGGNNAAIVLADAGLDQQTINGLVHSAFSFSGQRCTATRRLIVEQSIRNEFEKHLVKAVERLRIGDPHEEDCQIGPLISPDHLARVQAAVERAVTDGGRLLCGGARVNALSGGCWFMPTLITDVHPDRSIVQEETFGPVAVITAAENLDEAIALANAVPQGLVAAVLTQNPQARSRFAEWIEAGILKLSAEPLSIHPDAPFGGWKASRIGPPEHGIWDREFYSRPQVIYGKF